MRARDRYEVSEPTGPTVGEDEGEVGMDSHHEFKVRRVMDVESLKQDPEGMSAFTGMIGYLIMNDMLNVHFEGKTNFQGSLHMVMSLLMDHTLEFVCYGDPHDPTQWKLEEGPNISSVNAIPIDINLN
jgi:hypothetical protein